MVLLILQVFITDLRATKKQIKNAVLRLYDIQTKRINTLIRCRFAARHEMIGNASATALSALGCAGR